MNIHVSFSPGPGSVKVQKHKYKFTENRFYGDFFLEVHSCLEWVLQPRNC